MPERMVKIGSKSTISPQLKQEASLIHSAPSQHHVSGPDPYSQTTTGHLLHDYPLPKTLTFQGPSPVTSSPFQSAKSGLSNQDLQPRPSSNSSFSSPSDEKPSGLMQDQPITLSTSFSEAKAPGTCPGTTSKSLPDPPAEAFLPNRPAPPDDPIMMSNTDRLTHYVMDKTTVHQDQHLASLFPFASSKTAKSPEVDDSSIESTARLCTTHPGTILHAHPTEQVQDFKSPFLLPRLSKQAIATTQSSPQDHPTLNFSGESC